MILSVIFGLLCSFAFPNSAKAFLGVSDFLSNGGIYFSNGQGAACPIPYDMAIEWGINLGQSGLPYYPMNDLGLDVQGLCGGGHTTIPLGAFLTADGTVYFSNGAVHSCIFQYVPAGLNFSGLAMYPTFPSDLVINDGVCAGWSGPNLYPAKSKPTVGAAFITQGGIFISNNDGHVCQISYNMAIAWGLNMTSLSLPYFPSLSQGEYQNDGLCGGGSYTLPYTIPVAMFATSDGTIYFSNGAGHACSFSFAGGIDTTKSAIYPTFPSDIIHNDGPCANPSPYTDVKSFGATGNGKTSDTVAVQEALSSGKNIYFPPGTYLTGDLEVQTPIVMTGALATLLQAPGTYSLSYHLRINPGANGTQISNLIFDGNQMAMPVASVNTRGVFIDANQVTFNDVTVRNYASTGTSLYGANFSATNSHFDNNGNLGIEILTTSAHGELFSSCTFNQNGWGFQKIPMPYSQQPMAVAFGMAIRYQAYDITIENSEAIDNGKDGLNVNQGSHDVVYTNTLTKGNGDGGFTIAADTDPNFAPGTNGEGQSPYNLTYNNCTAYNNYSSGIAAYVPTTNAQVVGGQFYNNGRVSGDLPPQDSYNKGIFFASGSQQINIQNAQVYDNRQSAVVTADGAGGVFQVKGWIPGTMANYAKVAVYSAQGNIRGYAWLRGETSNSVTLTPISYVYNPLNIPVANQDGVPLAAIQVGDTITQALQDIGVFMSSNSTGAVTAEGYGLRQAYTGVPATSTTHPGTWSALYLIFSNGSATNIKAVNSANETSTAAVNGVCPVSSCTQY